ncbi:hypothetical protein DPMN_035184 [Dreissena polymorpha]|uniref:Uncharacterized protein n=1 Tax=Dreissena polymorpha TaxID=45954 RepID=A0A9D4M8Z9_DREPO|nr:hypothetical protein DPMN_035184 [Dreissena polymorpha]
MQSPSGSWCQHLARCLSTQQRHGLLKCAPAARQEPDPSHGVAFRCTGLDRLLQWPETPPFVHLAVDASAMKKAETSFITMVSFSMGTPKTFTL